MAHYPNAAPEPVATRQHMTSPLTRGSLQHSPFTTLIQQKETTMIKAKLLADQAYDTRQQILEVQFGRRATRNGIGRLQVPGPARQFEATLGKLLIEALQLANHVVELKGQLPNLVLPVNIDPMSQIALPDTDRPGPELLHGLDDQPPQVFIGHKSHQNSKEQKAPTHQEESSTAGGQGLGAGQLCEHNPVGAGDGRGHGHNLVALKIPIRPAPLVPGRLRQRSHLGPPFEARSGQSHIRVRVSNDLPIWIDDVCLARLAKPEAFHHIPQHIHGQSPRYDASTAGRHRQHQIGLLGSGNLDASQIGFAIPRLKEPGRLRDGKEIG